MNRIMLVEIKWQTPVKTLKRGRGDCEDYAILKYHMLKDMGFPPDKLWLATGLTGETAHAIVVAKIGNTDYILDNGKSSVLTLEEFQQRHDKYTLGMVPSMLYNAAGVWRSDMHYKNPQSIPAFKSAKP